MITARERRRVAPGAKGCSGVLSEGNKARALSKKLVIIDVVASADLSVLPQVYPPQKTKNG